MCGARTRREQAKRGQQPKADAADADEAEEEESGVPLGAAEQQEGDKKQKQTKLKGSQRADAARARLPHQAERCANSEAGRR